MADAKKMAALIVGKMEPKEEATEESAGDEGLEAAAADVIAAVKSGDAGALVSALRDFVSMCDYGEV